MHHYTANKCLEVDILYNNLVLFSLLYLVLLLTTPVSVLCGIACLIDLMLNDVILWSRD